MELVNDVGSVEDLLMLTSLGLTVGSMKVLVIHGTKFLRVLSLHYNQISTKPNKTSCNKLTNCSQGHKTNQTRVRRTEILAYMYINR